MGNVVYQSASLEDLNEEVVETPAVEAEVEADEAIDETIAE